MPLGGMQRSQTLWVEWRFEITRQRLWQFRWINVFHCSSFFVLTVWFSCKPLALWRVNECTCAPCLCSVSAYDNKTNTVMSVNRVWFTNSWHGTSSVCLVCGVSSLLRARGMDAVSTLARVPRSSGGSVTCHSLWGFCWFLRRPVLITQWCFRMYKHRTVFHRHVYFAFTLWRFVLQFAQHQ